MPQLAGMVIARRGVAHEMEDAHHTAFSQGVFAIADGVSRPNYEERGAIESDHVRQAARTFCDIAVAQLAASEPDTTRDSLREIPILVTETLKHFNEGFGFSFPYQLDGDPYAAVGVAARVDRGRVLQFGFIGDVGLAILTAAGALEIMTHDQLIPMRRYLESCVSRTEKERRALIRKELRNHLETLDREKRACGYGVLNGDERALRFWHVASRALNPGDLILAFTDGAIGLVENPAFQTCLRKHAGQARWDVARAEVMDVLRCLEAEQPEKFRDDLSLIVAELDGGL